jgi:hypothetical protein
MDLCNQDREPFTPLGAHVNRSIAASAMRAAARGS